MLPSFTFSASAHAAAWNNRLVRFVECDPYSFQLDLDDAAHYVNGASALLATHIFGAPCDPVGVEKLSHDAGVPVVFDAAHAFGATADGRPIGGFGDVEVFSLTPTKVMVAGEGGLVSTDDSHIAHRMRLGREYGNPGNYDTQFVGLNARMSELHAALGLESLEIVDSSLEKRRQLVRRYLEGLDDIPGITPQAVSPSDSSTYKDFTVAVCPAELGLDRDQLVSVLAADGIETRNYFDPPVHRHAAYRLEQERALPVTDATSARVVSLPIYPDLGDDDVDRVVEVVRAAHDTAEAVAATLGGPGFGEVAARNGREPLGAPRGA